MNEGVEATSGAVVTDPSAQDPIPTGLKVAAGFTWRVLVVGVGIAAVAGVAVWLEDIVVPFLLGLLLSALLVPLSAFLQRHRWPRWAAVITAWVVVFAVLTGLILLVAAQVRSQLPALGAQAEKALDSAQALIAKNPFGVKEADLDMYVSQLTTWLQEHASDIGLGAAEAGSGVAHLLEGLFIIIFVTLFALLDGRRIWEWTTRLFPAQAQPRIRVAGDAGWHTLTSFIRIQLVVAATDALGVGIGAAILGVPLAVPIAVIVFFGAFVPVVGAIVGGAVAVGIALVFLGWVHALIMLGIVVLVQQLESHLLHPLLTGSAVKVHPLGVVLGVVTGTAAAGVVGAFFAVPFIATVNSMVMAARRWAPQTATVEPAAHPAASSADPEEQPGPEPAR
ncbi:AI-2E family transporter [Brachybacterium sp. NBEC-018]|uniref:AI-2E family transporter n=1 Tax=Brachybacterium sp. NBEC-018 TaxID=2996004 RepID=UPI0021752084|nr:AI-2E family transporter [Brachybacterium sp. NBEC-018]UVY84667.1 AI-2E family transporter [Brachybacterium sp. NBEC-018]